MEITRQTAGDVLELTVTGRLDAMWAEHLWTVVADAARAGSARISADLTGVTYLSSAGVGALVKAYQEASAQGGAFWIGKVSERVRKVLEIVGLEETLMTPPASAKAARSVETENAVLHVEELASGGKLTCRLHGDPGLLPGYRFGAKDVARVPLEGSALAVGVGAFGETFEDSRERFGELVSVSGRAAYLPTDDSGAPDFLLPAGDYVPEVQLLYGLSCHGAFSIAAHFEARGKPVRLGELAAAALSLSGQDAAAIALVGEPTALVGAAARRSPASGPAEGAPFAFPGVRRWLSFTAESGGPRRGLLLAGVVTRAASPGASRLAPFVRSFAGDAALLGHVHAAAFGLRQTPARTTDPAAAAAALFEGGALRSVLHVLSTTRDGETELLRGTLWTAPLELPG